MVTRSEIWFRRWAILTFGVTLLLVFVGGFVRVSGAGLGCPDWPKCWGVWLPPSSLEEVDLPAVLKDFQEKRPELEMEDLKELFVPFKIWVEYVNRLLGVLVGLLVFVQFLLALLWKRGSKGVLWAAFLAVPLVGFQGWLGGQVVKTGLDSAKISAHLFGAAVLLAVLAWVMANAKERYRVRVKGGMFWGVMLCAVVLLVVTVVQGVFGVEVRSGVDEVRKLALEENVLLKRGEWLEQVSEEDHRHRLMAWAVVLATAGVAWLLRRSGARWLLIGIVGCVFSQIVAGIALAYLDYPRTCQILHLGGSTLLISLVFLLVVSLRSAEV